MVYFRSQYQSLFNLLTVCVLLGGAVVCGCSEHQNRNALTPAETTTQPITRRNGSRSAVRCPEKHLDNGTRTAI